MVNTPALALFAYGPPGPYERFHDHGHDGPYWPWMLLALLGWLVFVAVVVWLVTRAVAARRAHQVTPVPPTAPPLATSRAEEVLAERYARGEIDTEEFRERLHHLRESGAPPPHGQADPGGTAGPWNGPPPAGPPPAPPGKPPDRPSNRPPERPSDT